MLYLTLLQRSEEHALRELEENAREVNGRYQAVISQGSEIKHKTQQLMADMQSLDTQQGQQLNLLKRNFPDVARAWEWIQDNKGEFEKEVFGPPMICCSVKNDRYSDAIQAMLQVDDYVCFTAQTKADYKKLSDQIYRVMSLSVNIRTCSVPLSSFKPPATGAQLTDIGLDGFAVDFLEGPEPVLAMLCAEKRLHLSGIAVMDHSEEQYERLANSERISQWAAGRQLYTVRRRKEYGPKAMTTITKSILPGKFWTSQPVDVQEKARIQSEIDDLQRRKEPLKEEHGKLKEQMTDIDHEKEAINAKIDTLKTEKSALQKEFQRWQSLPQKIENEERQKAVSEEAMREARKTLTEIQYEWDFETLKRIKLALRHKQSIERVRVAHQTLIEYRLCLIEANSDVAGLKDLNAHLMEQLEQERKNLEEASRESTESRDAGRLISDELKEILARAPDKQDIFAELCEGKSPEEMRNLIDAEEAQLELIHAANPNVMRDFNKRAEEIAKIKAKMDKAGGEMSELNSKLQSLMGKWEPKLDELVAQINDAFAYNFEQISCAGEVRVDKADDFDNWALDIMVRFRYVSFLVMSKDVH